uniref:Uncharacterized protein n=1 Tax=Leersia perrieri TaxID=77586 RepID=A0A0D9VRN0_9ORYZ
MRKSTSTQINAGVNGRRGGKDVKVSAGGRRGRWPAWRSAESRPDTGGRRGCGRRSAVWRRAWSRVGGNDGGPWAPGVRR